MGCSLRTYRRQLGVFVPHLVTLIIEGQAYLIAAFAVWIHGRKILQPTRFNLPTRTAGYKAGFKDTLRLYPLVLILLLVEAVYEAIEVIYIVPRALTKRDRAALFTPPL